MPKSKEEIGSNVREWSLADIDAMLWQYALGMEVISCYAQAFRTDMEEVCNLRIRERQLRLFEIFHKQNSFCVKFFLQDGQLIPTKIPVGEFYKNLH